MTSPETRKIETLIAAALTILRQTHNPRQQLLNKLEEAQSLIAQIKLEEVCQVCGHVLFSWEDHTPDCRLA
jgi:hypothetical protein